MKEKIQKKKRRSGRRSIVTYWQTTSLGMVTAALLVIGILLAGLLKNYYYSSARQYLTSHMNIITGSLDGSGGENVNYSAQIRSMVEGYEDNLYAGFL